MQDGGQSGKAGRPRVTIEGKAREVADAAEAPDGARDTEPGTAPEAERDAQPRPAAGDEATGGADNDAGPAPSGLAALVISAEWRTRLVTAAIAAGAAVAIVFLILATLRYASDTTARVVRSVSGAEEARGEVAQLSEDLAALRARVASSERIEDRLADLERRAGRIEAGMAAGEANAARITALEDRFGALDNAGADTSDALARLRDEIAAAADAGTSAAAVAARLTRATARLDALAGRINGFEQNMSALASDIAGLETGSEALTGRLEVLEEAGGPSGEEGRISERLDAIESDIARLGGRADDLALPAAAAAHAALAAKAREGQPFTRELELVRAVIGAAAEIDALGRYAGRATATLADLQARLGELQPANDGPAEPAGPDNSGDGDNETGSLFDRLIARAGDAVRVRRVDEDAAPSGLDKARDLIGAGDLAGAMALVEQAATGPASDVWLADAAARAGLDRAVGALGELIGRLPAGDQDG